MIEAVSQNVSESVAQSQPTGPTLIDDRGCRCALQKELSTEAWRCVANTTTDIYLGQTERWFFAVNQTNSASLHDLPNSDSNPPNVSTSYFIESNGQNGQFVETNSSEETTNLGDVICSGRNDTNASSAFYRYVATSITESSSPCWQPGIIPLTIQNASEWKATGCSLGFLCKCAGA